MMAVRYPSGWLGRVILICRQPGQAEVRVRDRDGYLYLPAIPPVLLSR
jgi:hypothetical protein